MLPEQVPERYDPLWQLVLEHVEHCALPAEEQPFDMYLPAPQVEQVVHPKPLLVPAHDPVRYLPLAHVIDEHVLHRNPSLVPLQAPDLQTTIRRFKKHFRCVWSITRQHGAHHRLAQARAWLWQEHGSLQGGLDNKANEEDWPVLVGGAVDGRAGVACVAVGAARTASRAVLVRCAAASGARGALCVARGGAAI